MTEDEERELAAKLARIWVPRSKFPTEVNWSVKEGRFGFHANVQEGIKFFCADDPKGSCIDAKERRIFALTRSAGEERTGHLRTFTHIQEISVYDDGDKKVLFQQFACEWMAFFRRGCWLSGCPIECTAHEQMEWTQWLREREVFTEV